MRKIFSILIFSLAGLAATGQTAEVGAFGGISYYLGDLNPGKHFLMPKPAYGVVARVNLNPRWAIKGNGYFGRVAGDDNVSNTNRVRGLNFESRVTDISVVAEFNFYEYFTGSRRNTVSPYIFAGIGMFLFKPQSGGVELNPLGTEGQNIGFEGRKPYKLVSLAFPFGLGVKYSLNSRLALSAEWGMRKGFTDYLDDVSKTYYFNSQTANPNDPAQALSDPTFSHQPYQERGNPTTRDWYNFTGVTLTYKFKLFGGKKCYDQIRKSLNS